MTLGGKSQIISKTIHIYNDPTPRNRTFKDFPDPRSSLSLGETQGRKSEHRLDAKEGGRRITNPRISYLTHDSSFQLKPSQIPFRQLFGGVQFLVFKAAFSGERVSDYRRWKKHMSENMNAMNGGHEHGHKARSQSLQERSKSKWIAGWGGGFREISNSPCLSPMEHANAVWRSKTRWTESKSRQVQAVSSRQLFAERGSWSLKNCSITRPSR